MRGRLITLPGDPQNSLYPRMPLSPSMWGLTRSLERSHIPHSPPLLLQISRRPPCTDASWAEAGTLLHNHQLSPARNRLYPPGTHTLPSDPSPKGLQSLILQLSRRLRFVPQLKHGPCGNPHDRSPSIPLCPCSCLSRVLFPSTRRGS